MMNGCARHFREKMDLRPAFPPCPHPHPVPLGPPFPHSSFPPLSYRSSLEGWHFQLNRTRDHHYGNSRPCSPCETSWEVGGAGVCRGLPPPTVFTVSGELWGFGEAAGCQTAAWGRGGVCFLLSFCLCSPAFSLHPHNK